ncbi:anaerobic ribonucleoside-triphosphate reductase, partial [Jutongia sp.]
IAGEVSKDLTKRVLLPEKIIKAHEEGVIHFHDMDYYLQSIFNCCLINIGDMLENGTVMNGKLIESPKSFQVACTVMTQIISAVASSQYGGQSVDIRHLGKYLRKTRDKYERHYKEKYGDIISDEIRERFIDDRLRDELRSGVQTIQYQINTLMTTNGQSPFVTLFLNLDKDDPYIEENAMIIEEILKQRIEGIKNEKGVYVTPAFPKLIYVLDEHNCLKGGKYDYLTKLAVKCSAKRMYPDYISAKMMRENYEGNVFSCMGCRSFLTPWKDENGEFKFEGRFNQGVVSLNLPQIGILAEGDEEKFWALLEERLALCFEALMCRHHALEGTLSNVSPIHWQYGAIARLKSGETIDKLLHDGYSTISLGYIGLYEVTKLMTGVSHTDPKGTNFALRLMKRLRLACDTWKLETGLGFGLYGTPAESLCYRFAEIDKKRFGEIKDVTDKGYYTNSYHVDVREKIDAFEKFRFESQFQKISSGGAISYVEIPNMRHNLEALEDVVRFIYDNIQYAEFNTKSDYCHVCGYDGEIIINDDLEWECPQCHNKDKNKMNVTRRTCGYLGENFWNVGKTKEINARTLHL